MPEQPWIREHFTSEQRSAELTLTIDPGFVHHRKIATLLGTESMRHIDDAVSRLPEMPDYLRRVRIDRIYTDALLTFCELLGVPPLASLMARGRGRLFCSVVELEAAEELADRVRAINRVIVPGVDDLTAVLEYSLEHIAATTTRLELRKGDAIAVVAELHDFSDGRLVFHPLVMGGPWLEDRAGSGLVQSPEWHSYDFFEIFIEDIDEFQAVRAFEVPRDFEVMRDVSEAALKICLGEILGDATGPDWGGEMSDHFTAHLHLNGQPTTAAFLLKGPARFAPMGLNHLGKNNDQIYRLSQESAQLLVVQHAHEISGSVRATLRAFAVQPGAARRYCLMDGRDSLRLLIAYDKFDRALELSAA
jgi:hypothetical protein